MSLASVVRQAFDFSHLPNIANRFELLGHLIPVCQPQRSLHLFVFFHAVFGFSSQEVAQIILPTNFVLPYGELVGEKLLLLDSLLTNLRWTHVREHPDSGLPFRLSPIFYFIISGILPATTSLSIISSGVYAVKKFCKLLFIVARLSLMRSLHNNNRIKAAKVG